MKLKSSDPIETLRDQVREQASADSRFKSSAGLSVWVSDLIPPEADSDTGWRAIIGSPDGKLYEVPFAVADGKVTLGDSSQEVFRKTSYLPIAARAMRGSETAVPLQARCAAEITSADKPWMFAPGGLHTITCGAGHDGGAAEVTLQIDETTAVVLNARLAELNTKHAPQRTFIDREHDKAAGATAWPKRFFWATSPEPGVYVEHEPSELGKQLVEGKIVRAFSPSFYSDAALPKNIRCNQLVAIAAGKRGSPENPARMIGLIFPACGTLTNNPAFKKILPLWANNAAKARPQQTPQQKLDR